MLLRDSASNLDVSYPLNVKDSGKAKLDLVWNQGKSPLDMLIGYIDTERTSYTILAKRIQGHS